MAKENVNAPNLTRGDKVHKKFMDKLDVFKDGMTKGLDSFTLVHKQTLDASTQYAEVVAKSQEAERAALYEVIKTCEDEARRKEAFERLKELDQIKEGEIKRHNDFTHNEREKAYINISGSIICLGVAAGLISNKQVRQATGKFLTTAGKKILRLK